MESNTKLKRVRRGLVEENIRLRKQVKLFSKNEILKRFKIFAYIFCFRLITITPFENADGAQTSNVRTKT